MVVSEQLKRKLIIIPWVFLKINQYVINNLFLAELKYFKEFFHHSIRLYVAIV